METDEDVESQDIIPASPPTYASHKTSKKFIPPVVELQEEDDDYKPCFTSSLEEDEEIDQFSNDSGLPHQKP